MDYAAKKNATVLVSQHINSTNNNQDSVSGSLVFVATGNYRPDLKTKSWALSNTILNELSKLGLKNLGLQIRTSENQYSLSGQESGRLLRNYPPERSGPASRESSWSMPL